MTQALTLIARRFIPPLDPAFRPAALANRAFQAEVGALGGGVPLVPGARWRKSTGGCSMVYPPLNPSPPAALHYPFPA